MIKIAVGSENPIKIKAVETAFKKVFGKGDVTGVSVSSGVSDMPLSFEEIVDGAKNRAEGALKETGADFGVGLEGGFEGKAGFTFLTSFVAVVDKSGVWGYGHGGGLLMPDKIVKKVREEGKELGDVMDEIRGLKNTKQNEGCIGFFTDNLIPRKESFEVSVIRALSRFSKKEMFK